jgi:hypothetical protein
MTSPGGRSSQFSARIGRAHVTVLSKHTTAAPHTVEMVRPPSAPPADQRRPGADPLELEGTDTIFGLPGGAILPVYDPILDSADPPHPRAPRAGRRPHGRGLRPRHRPPGVAMVTSPARRPPTSSPRWPTPTWTRCRWSASPARCPRHRIGTDAFQECDTVGITRGDQAQRAGDLERPGHPAGRPPGVPHRHHRAPRARCCSTSPRTSSTRPTPTLGGVVLAHRRRGACACPATARRRLATPARSSEAAS